MLCYDNHFIPALLVKEVRGIPSPPQAHHLDILYLCVRECMMFRLLFHDASDPI